MEHNVILLELMIKDFLHRNFERATCFFLGISEFSLYCYLTGLEQNLSSKISCIKLGFK